MGHTPALTVRSRGASPVAACAAMGRARTALLALLASASLSVATATTVRQGPGSEPKRGATAPTPLVPPPARAAIAGLRGFESRSRLEYPAQPGRLHDLRAAYVFPERVRWWIAARDGAYNQSRIRYQYGQHVLAVEPTPPASVEYRAEDRTAILAAFDLRRALFLWPDDRPWSGTGATRTAKNCLGELLRATVAGTPPRPTSIECVPDSRENRDCFRAITWTNSESRAWPATFEVWNGATVAWRESVDVVDVTTRFIDSFFLPADRRGVVGDPVEGVRDLDIPPVCLRRVALPDQASWKRAREEQGRLRAEAREAKLPDIEDWFTFELGAEGAPTAVLLRLARVPAHPPEGYTTIPDRIGTATAVTGLAAVDQAVLRRLIARMPEGSTAGKAYARFDGSREEPDVVVLVVPAEASEPRETGGDAKR